jgi:hypothetical protein
MGTGRRNWTIPFGPAQRAFRRTCKVVAPYRAAARRANPLSCQCPSGARKSGPPRPVPAPQKHLEKAADEALRLYQKPHMRIETSEEPTQLMLGCIFVHGAPATGHGAIVVDDEHTAGSQPRVKMNQLVPC